MAPTIQYLVGEKIKSTFSNFADLTKWTIGNFLKLAANFRSKIEFGENWQFSFPQHLHNRVIQALVIPLLNRIYTMGEN